MSVKLLDARELGGAPMRDDGRRRCYRRRRPLDAITQVCVHHWGVRVGLGRRRGETREAAAIRRARSTVYHVDVFRDMVVVAWPFDLVTWHGNGFNATSVGLAIAGRFPSFEAVRGPEHDDPLDFLDAIEVALNFLDSELPGLRHVVTHSQAAPKPSDPGELAARLAVQIGRTLPRPLTPRPDLVLGDGARRGAAWPECWRQPVSLDRRR